MQFGVMSLWVMVEPRRVADGPERGQVPEPRSKGETRAAYTQVGDTY